MSPIVISHAIISIEFDKAHVGVGIVITSYNKVQAITSPMDHCRSAARKLNSFQPVT